MSTKKAQQEIANSEKIHNQKFKTSEGLIKELIINNTIGG
jgi:hypothetical protein